MLYCLENGVALVDFNFCSLSFPYTGKGKEHKKPESLCLRVCDLSDSNTRPGVHPTWGRFGIETSYLFANTVRNWDSLSITPSATVNQKSMERRAMSPLRLILVLLSLSFTDLYAA